MDEGAYNAGSVADTPHLPIGVGVPTLSATGVLINEPSNYSAGATKTLTVDSVDATSHFAIGDEVLTNGGALLGVVHSITPTSITLTTKNIVAVNNNDNLKKVSALATGLYGRSTNMMTIGMALHSYTPTSTYYYGRDHNTGTRNAYDPIYFNGALSDVAVWDKQLTADDIAELYSARTVWD